ncbi:hypothetical protein ABMA28_010014 [Loxostege sticticalis]|uniref:Uncharacterized protein n=1 Tax=Loxostege sticticalis TaxID=481309 RepID=A0ABD0S9E2_LOXSC
MKIFWICLLVLSVAAVNAQQDDESLDWGDYSDLYDDFEPSLFDPEGKKQDGDKKEEEKHSKEEFDQIEDNRSVQNEDDSKKEVEAKADEDGLNEGDKVDVKSEENKSEDDAVYMDELPVLPGLLMPQNDSLTEMKTKEKDTKIEDVLEETKQILEETDDNFEDTDNNEDGDINDKYAEEAIKDILNSSKGDLIEEDTVDKVYQDLNEDLDKLMETWKKLSDGNIDDIEPEKNADDSLDPKEIAEYEKKFGEPYGEKYVLSLRQDQNYDEADYEEKMSDEVDDDDDDADSEGQEIEQSLKASTKASTIGTKDDNKVINEDGEENKNVDDGLFKDDPAADVVINEDGNENKNDDDGLFKDDPDADDATSEEDDEYDDDDVAMDGEANNDGLLIEAGDDAILDNKDYNEVDKNNDEIPKDYVLPASLLRDTNVEENVEKKSTPTINLVETLSSSKDEIVPSTVTETATTLDVTHLNAEQYDQLMAEFVQAHADDISNDGLGRNAGPIEITLTQEPTLVTSPNHPNPYPTNNVIDWMFTGDGEGIELIIHDFFVNGVIGDYLLIKPGGTDASGQDGLVFSHMLNEERRYRFLDVDRMFVRFAAHPGFSFRPGFSFSVRMVSPPPGEDEAENLPEPEAIAPVPVETFTVLIGGLTLPQFNESVEQFRLLIADMATMYINANDIDPGLNTTRQVTQITNVAVCNLNWPNSDMCSEVSFGVPLVYDDDDDENRKPRLNEGELRAMWYLWSAQDPFASRLRELGMEEFNSPNDSGVLTVWLVIGFGLLISMAMLAFALWRFSCFENYARMPTHSDRDSVYSKQGLDLYPTPHQTLPPLFAENEYKWDDAKFEDSTRVDLGGFTNKSYARDELFDIDSDEDVITPNKRDRGFQPRGFEV